MVTNLEKLSLELIIEFKREMNKAKSLNILNNNENKL
jgi:hypothetical protein